MTRFDPISLPNKAAAILAAELRDAAEGFARILDRVSSREASHALTLLEGAVMFGTRALVKAPHVEPRKAGPLQLPGVKEG